MSLIKISKNSVLILLVAIFSLVFAISGALLAAPFNALFVSMQISKSISADLAESFATVLTPIIFFVYYLIRRNKTGYKTVMPYRAKGFISKYFISWLVGLSAFILIWIIAAIFGAFKVTNVWNSANIVLIILFIVAYGFQGMSEEIICRGFLQGAVSKIAGPAFGITISVIFFAVFHSFNSGLTVLAFVNLLIYSLGMSVIRYRTDNLWICGGIHSAWNFAQGTISGVLVSGIKPSLSIFTSAPVGGMTWANGGTFGMEGSILCTIIYSTILLGALVLLKKKA
ncbi:type II CAAX endopeptidase family protein [Fructilactobacillus vespulae]|uniref:CPBP family intramembrane glutamic endopeptidase n=1 Tax=Fructilactobacillus vespulae TaxID=1249630 RepID=UPI0039B651C7